MQTFVIGALILFLGLARSSRGQYVTDNADNAGRNMTSCPQTTHLFPRRSSADYIRLKTPIAPIDEFSICTWAKGYGTGTFWGTILSYATPEQFNQLLILFDYKGNERLYIEALGEGKENIRHPLVKGDDNFMCFVIGRIAGFVKVYYNATLDTVLSFNNRNRIPSGGTFIIGQDQDSYVGRFDKNQAIYGEIRNYRIWNRVLTHEEIGKMYRSRCNCAKGHAVSLSPGQIQLEGGVNALYDEQECE